MTVASIDEPLRVKRSNQQHLIISGAKVGATAGWAVNAATNVGRLATVPASQSASTLIIPINFMKIGWAITGYWLLGQIESAGNAVTLDAAIQSVLGAAADLTTGAVTGTSMTQISVTADTLIHRGNSRKTFDPLFMSGLNTYSLMLTATTLGSTDIDMAAVVIEVQER